VIKTKQCQGHSGDGNDGENNKNEMKYQTCGGVSEISGKCHVAVFRGQRWAMLITAVRSGPVQHLNFPNLELDLGFGSGNTLELDSGSGSVQVPVRTQFSFPRWAATQSLFQNNLSIGITTMSSGKTQPDFLTMLNSTIRGIMSG
jgi:hypothetical protein